MTSPLTLVRQTVESSLTTACQEWGKVISLREAMNLTYSQQVGYLGPKWAILQWEESKPEAWGPALEGQKVEPRLWLIDRGLDSQNRAEEEDQVRARFEALSELIKSELFALDFDISSFRLDFGQAQAPLKKLAESRENPHIALLTCQVTVVWPQNNP